MNLWDRVTPASKRSSRGVRVAIASVAAAFLMVPGSVYALHTFTDVPDAHPFHDDISWLAGTGITSGCTATTYCPGAAVTRGQMSRFLKNNYTLLAGMSNGQYVADFLTVPATGNYIQVGSTKVTIPAGTKARLIINFSAESQCSGGVNGVDLFNTIYPACEVRVMVNGTEVNTTTSDYLWDSSLGAEHAAGDWNSNAMVRFTGELSAGVKTVTVEAKPLECIALCGGYSPPKMSLRHRVLTVQAMPADPA